MDLGGEEPPSHHFIHDPITQFQEIQGSHIR